MKAETTTVDADEIAHFSRLSASWWDERGPFAPLHRINPLRIGFILERIQDSGFRIQEENNPSLNPESRILNPSLRLLDIGCGGGLICEPMARLGANVTGIDASEKNIEIAKLHAAQSGLVIDYRCTTAEELVASCELRVASESLLATRNSQLATPFDIVLALEIVEHVADVEAFAAAACALAKPGGLIIFSTLNRTPKSYALGIVAAEYVLRWVPRGTHDWKRFLRPSELCAALRRQNIEITQMTGMVYSPLSRQWRLDASDLSVNYLVAGRKPA